MPIDIQIKGRQLASGAVDYSKIDSASVETDLSVSASSSKLATAAAIKSYADSLVADSFEAGNGIEIDASGSPDVISVKLAATNPMLQFVGTGTDELQVKLDPNKGLQSGAGGLSTQLKAESGGTISVDASGLYIADAAIGNAKLANSTISGKALGSNLDNISAGNGLSGSDYNGSAAQTFQVQANVSDGTIAVDSNGVKVADSSIKSAKLAIQTNLDKFTANGSTAAFTLSAPVPTEFAYIQVFVNGLFMEQVASAASGKSEFVLNPTGGASGEGLVTFGANLDSGDLVRVLYIADA